MRITLAVFVGVVALLVPGTAAAAPPPNDSFANAVDLAPLPFDQSVNVAEATGGEPGEVAYCSALYTAWYSYTPSSNEVLRITAAGSSFFGSVLNAYRQDGTDLSGLTHLGCAQFGNSLSISVQAGETYYIQAGGVPWYSPGTIQLGVSVIPPPANDDFANTDVIGSLAFSETTDTSAATTESGEPNPSCNYTNQPAVGSIWYRYTPSVNGSLMASTFGSYPTTVFAAYSGSALGSLSELACRTQYGRMTFAVQAGQTYTFLVASLFGVKGNVAFQLDVAPNPVVNLGRSIWDPSSYDTVQFYNGAWDPAEVGISAYEWDFGDGSTSSDPNPAHRYLADGSYTLRLTVRTPDGRSTTSEQVVPVATHDVAIAKLTVPQSASIGQTRSLVVGLQNRRYAETVRVDLYRSTASGFVYFASSTQAVPVRAGNRTTDFAFSYTFTSDDAALGKVNFKAIAMIVSARDALLTNNEAISLQTKVNS